MKKTNKVKNQKHYTIKLHKRAAFVIAIAVVALGGLSLYAYSKPTEPLATVETQPIVPESNALPNDLNEILTFDEVKQLATKDTEARVTNFELDTKDSSVIFKVTLSDGTVILLDAVTGQKLENTEFESENDDDEPLPADATVSLSFEEARKIAAQKYPNSVLEKIQLEVEEGRVVLSVRFQDKARVDMDAKTGEIVRTKDPRVQKAKSKRQTKHSSSNRGSTNKQEDSNDDDSSKQNSRSGSSGSKSGSSRDYDDKDEDSEDDNEIRVEGTLFVSNNTYKVSAYGVTYTIKYSDSLSGLVGKLVRVEGELRSGNVIIAEEVKDRT